MLLFFRPHFNGNNVCSITWCISEISNWYEKYLSIYKTAKIIDALKRLYICRGCWPMLYLLTILAYTIVVRCRS